MNDPVDSLLVSNQPPTMPRLNYKDNGSSSWIETMGSAFAERLNRTTTGFGNVIESLFPQTLSAEDQVALTQRIQTIEKAYGLNLRGIRFLMTRAEGPSAFKTSGFTTPGGTVFLSRRILNTTYDVSERHQAILSTYENTGTFPSTLGPNINKENYIAALKNIIHLDQQKKLLDDAAILVHESVHVFQNLDAGWFQLFVHKSFHGKQASEEAAYSAADDFLSTHGADISRRREEVSGYFMDIFHSEDITQSLVQKAYQESNNPRFQSMLKTLWREYFIPMSRETLAR